MLLGLGLLVLIGQRSSLKRTRTLSVRQTLEVFQSNVGGNFRERRGGAHMGFFKRIDTILNWTELIGQAVKVLLLCAGFPLRNEHLSFSIPFGNFSVK